MYINDTLIKKKTKKPTTKYEKKRKWAPGFRAHQLLLEQFKYLLLNFPWLASRAPLFSKMKRIQSWKSGVSRQDSCLDSKLKGKVVAGEMAALAVCSLGA